MFGTRITIVSRYRRLVTPYMQKTLLVAYFFGKFEGHDFHLKIYLKFYLKSILVLKH